MKHKSIRYEVEGNIYDAAMEVMPSALKRVKHINFESRYLAIPFMCEGCIDKLIYDKEMGKFTKIEYSKGIGKADRAPGMSKYAACFDDYKICEILL